MMYRNMYDILTDILVTCTEQPCGILSIMYGAKINWKQLKDYVALLTEKQLLVLSETPKGVRRDGRHYSTTKKGMSFVDSHMATRRFLQND